MISILCKVALLQKGWLLLKIPQKERLNASAVTHSTTPTP